MYFFSLKYFFLTGTILLSLMGYSYAISDSDGSDVQASEQKQASKHSSMFLGDLKLFEESLSRQDYIMSLEVLEKIKDRVLFQQHKVIAAFFPEKMEMWKVKKQDSVSETELGDDNYGVIFTQRYFNKQGHTIEVNVVNAEELIRDYKDVFNNPSLVKGMGNTQIIDYSGYKIIETILKDVKHIEQTIVLSNTVFMTIVAIGIDDDETLKSFLDTININGLGSYLN